MPQDAYTLKYLCDELNNVFANGKVNRITQPNNDQVVFTIYTGKSTKRLLVDVNPAQPRISVIENEKDSPLTAPNFCMLLRKHLLSASIERISLVGFDRIVKIDFLSSGEFFDSQLKTLYLELMGRYSNVILTQDGKILGGNRGINMFDNGVRPLIVSKPYVLPPINNKLEPLDKGVVNYFLTCKADFAEHIFNGIQGLAKSTANEIVNSYVLKKGINKEEILQNIDDFYQYFIDFIYNSKINACVEVIGDKVNDVFVKPYCLKENKNLKYFSTLYQAEDYYFEQKNKTKEFENCVGRVKNVINSAIKKARKRLTAITSKERDAIGLDDDKLYGELILANVYRISIGQEQVELENWYEQNKLVKITLDKNLTPAKNAERYFKKYNKKKRTLVAFKPQKEQAEQELEYLNSILSEIDLCEEISEAKLVLKELEDQGLIKANVNQKKRANASETSCREYLVNGYVIKVGRNNTENDKVTFLAKAEAIWLHSKDYHSSHIIIEPKEKEIPQEVIKIGAEICAYFSKAREGGKTEVVYTKRKFVKKPPHSKPGFCIYQNFSSITVEPNKRQEFIKNG